MNLTGFANIQMSFDYRGQMETFWDRFNVLASSGPIAPPSGLLNPTVASNMRFIDLGSVVRPELGRFAYDTSSASGGQSGIARFDLSAFADSVVNLRFQFGSDFSVVGSGFNMDNLQITGDASGVSVPEPASLALLGLGLAGLGFTRRRKRA